MSVMPKPGTSVPRCSVVVCTRDRQEALNRCLAALAQQSYSDYEIIVVDNAPSDGSSRDVAERWGAQYLVERHIGLSRARNAGARACSGDIVAFTDDDAVPEPEWLSMLVAEFRDHDVAVVTGRILPPGDQVDAYVSDLGPNRMTLQRSNPLWFEIACFGGIGNGGNMAFRRRLFETWRGFDERLGRGAFLSDAEEHRAFSELIERGCTITYTPSAIVRHPLPQTAEQRRVHYLRSRADLTGFTLFLFLVTSHRWKVGRYAIEALLGKTRIWRFRTSSAHARLVSRRELLLAYLSGPWRCLQALRQIPPGGPPPPQPWDRAHAAPRPEASILRLVEK